MPHKPKPTPRKPRKDRIVGDDVFAFTARMLAARMHKSEIKRELYKKYKLAARTAENAITGGRKLLVMASGKTEEQHKNDAYAFYNSIVSDPKVGKRLRLLAQELIDKLLATRGPIKIDLSGSIGTRHTIAHAILKDPESAKLLDALDDRLSKNLN